MQQRGTEDSELLSQLNREKLGYILQLTRQFFCPDLAVAWPLSSLDAATRLALSLTRRLANV